MNKLKAVRAKVIEAVPELIERATQSHCRECRCTDGFGSDFSEITLADVLRAIQRKEYDGYGIDAEGFFLRYEGNSEWAVTPNRWNLALPLDEQEPEVTEFLAKVLGV